MARRTPSTAGTPLSGSTPRRLALPLLACLLLYAIDLACIATVPESARAFALGFAVPFDLMVCVPAAFYLLVVRRNGLSPAFVLPVTGLGALVSSQFVQPGTFSLHLVLVPLAVAVDLAIGVHEARRLGHAFRAARQASRQPLDWFSDAFFALTRNRTASRMAGLECAIWYYLLGSWRRPADVPDGCQAFSYHRKSGFLALNGVIAVMVVIETAVVHVLAAKYSVVAACLLTATSLYLGAWLLGNARAVVLNPMLVGEGMLEVRWGAYFCERIPLHLVADVASTAPDLPKSQVMNLATMGAQPFWIVFSQPVDVHGVTGRTRRVRALNVSPDDAAAFRRALLGKG